MSDELTFKKYVERLQKLLAAQPELADAKAVYATDDEGNAFYPVHFSPTPGFFDANENYFLPENELETDEQVNAVCIN